MSGRDLRSFITHHRADEEEKLAVQAKSGVLNAKLKPIDYEGLKAFAAEKRVLGQEALLKIKKLKNASNVRKERVAINQHKTVWFKELSRLNEMAKRVQMEIDLFADEASLNKETQSLFTDLVAYERKLSMDFNAFKEDTVDPVMILRDDLKLWLQMTSCETSSSLDCSGDNDDVHLDKPEEVCATIHSVKKQQQHIIEQLSEEQSKQETKLNITGIYDSSSPPEQRIETGIPEEAFDLKCPDLQLKTSVLQEFILIDGKYVEKLNELEQHCNAVLEIKNGGWTGHDHSIFLYLNDQYTYNLQNRHMLFVDCLRRHLPKKSRADIVEHENWWTHFCFYHKRRHDLLSDWIRDRIELLNCAKVVFSEACQAKQLQKEKKEMLLKQREFCEALYSKVREWRENKMEMLKVEQEMAERQQQEMETLLAAVKERETAKRQQQKEKIKEFHSQLEMKQKLKEESDQHHLEEFQKYLTEQAVYNKERVKLREDKLFEKEECRMKKIKEEMTVREEKELILEALRKKVRPHVEADLARLWNDTIAWQAKQKPESDLGIHKPLYDINSFTAEQITADPRFRLEERLRQVGLHDKSYGREAMAAMKPLHLPRRDMESTVFKTS